MATDYDALFNYTAQQQGISPAQAKQNFLSKYGQAGTPAPTATPATTPAATTPAATTPAATTGGINSLANVNTVTPPEEKDDRVKVFSQIGSQGQGKGYQNIADAFGTSGQVERLYFTDPKSGRVFNYDYDEKEFEGLDPSYYGIDMADLQSAGGITKQDGENVRFDVADPSQFDVSGILGKDPETLEAERLEILKDDKSDNNLFYTTPDGRNYVDVSGTGEGIPVGSTNITRDPSESNTGPVLSKGFTSYYDQTVLDPKNKEFDQEEFDRFEADKDSPYGLEDLSFGNVFSLTPGGTEINTGVKNPFGDGDITFSNPPSQLQNLNPFFNQAESFGYENLKKQFDKEPSYLEELLGVTPVSKTIGEVIQSTGGSTGGGGSATGSGDDPGSGGGGGGGGGDTPAPGTGGGGGSTSFFAPAMKSAPTSTAVTEPINTDPRFQPIFPQQPIQPVGDVTNYPLPFEGPFGPGGIGSEGAPPQGGPAMPQPAPIPIEAQPAQSVPAVIPPPTFADVMAQGGTQGQAGINPYFQALEQLNASKAYSPIMGMKDGGGIMSLQKRMLMAPASRSMSQGIMS